MARKFKIRLCAIVFWTCMSLAQSGPIQRYVRVMREVYPEIEPEKVDGNLPQVCVVGDVVYEAEEPVPADQACLKCKCQPPGVHCETTRCLKKPGCRAIHKSNKCCPDYQCECEHEGRTYANGERLESKPGGECQVCYCRGGEVQCTEVSCYIRTDCQGKTVPGQCCPKYEHCPAIEPASGKMSPKPEVEEHETTTKTFVDPATNASAENEIGETTLSLEKEENLVPAESTTLISTGKISFADQFAQIEDLDDIDVPKITIHEIIPEIKEIPITEPPKQENTSNVQGQLLVEEKVPTVSDENHTNDVEDDPTLESSEVSEVFQHPPPVLRIGDQLLFLKKGQLVPEKDASTPSPVFTIIGAEGLQRGDIESMEHHETPKEIEIVPTDLPKRSITVEEEGEKFDDDDKAVDPPTVSSSNQADAAPIIDGESTSASQNTLKMDDNTTIDVAVELATGNFDEQDVENKNESSPVVVSEIASTTRKPAEEEQKIKIEEIVQLENPAYPPIPEIMSQQGAEYIDHNIEVVENTSKDSIENLESLTLDARILPKLLLFRQNETDNATETLINEKAALPEEILKELAPSDLLDVTTDFDLLTTSGNSGLKPGKRSSDLGTGHVPLKDFRHDDLLRYGTIIERNPLVENQVKKLADDDDIVGLSSVVASGERGRSTETLESSSGESTTPKGAPRASPDENVSVEDDRSDNNGNKSGDVEIIDPTLMALNSTNATTHEENSEEFRQDRVEKRTINREYDPESEKIFQELDSELHLLEDGHASAKNSEEEKKEAEIIFKELLDEVNASTSKTPQQSGGKPSDSDVLQRVSDAIAKFQLKEARQSLDASILGILRDFFTSQYRSYKDI